MPNDLWSEDSRIVIVAAHADDETIGMGGQLASLKDVTLLHVTDGAPRRRPDWKPYRQTRRAELLCAAALAGVPPERCIEFGLPDQEACRHLVQLSCHLSRLFEELKPEVIFTHPFEGGHPDHDATAFAVHHAASAPIVEFSSYHRGANGNVETGCFLAADSRPYRRGLSLPAGIDGELRTCLTTEQKFLKRSMLDCFTTQRETLQWFRIDHECFRAAPAYDFTKLPHAGRLFYESFDWGCNAVEWQRQARRAEEQIGTCLSR